MPGAPKLFPQNLCFPRDFSAQLPQVLHVSFWTTWLSCAWKDLETRCDTLSCSWTFSIPHFLSHAESLLWSALDFGNSTLTPAVMTASGKGEKYFITYSIYVGSLLDHCLNVMHKESEVQQAKVSVLWYWQHQCAAAWEFVSCEVTQAEIWQKSC